MVGQKRDDTCQGLAFTTYENPGYSLSEMLKLHRKYECQFGAEEVRKKLEDGTLGECEIRRMDALLWATHLDFYYDAGGDSEVLEAMETAQKIEMQSKRMETGEEAPSSGWVPQLREYREAGRYAAG